MRTSHVLAVLGLCALGFFGIGLSRDGLADLSEDQAKTSLIYNFTKFVQWPAGTPDKILAVCVYRDDPILPTLTGLRSRTSKGMAISVQRVNTLDEARACQVLFVDQSEKGSLRGVIQALRGQPVLLVSDVVDSASAGAVVEVFLSDRRIAFKINKAMADEANLKLSAQLLSLAKTLYEKK